MKEKRIITAALTGALSPKAVNPNVPVTPEEIAEDAYKCWKAGAAIVHLHMRDETDTPCCDVERFRKSKELIEAKCDVIVNMTTTGSMADNSSTDPEVYVKRMANVVELEPEMCSYDAASMNWMGAKPFAFQNTPEFLSMLNKVCKEHNTKPEIEIFNPGMFGVIEYFMSKGEFPGVPHFQYVLGVQGGLPAVPESVMELEMYRRRMFPDSTWSGFGTSKGNLPCIYTVLAMGGHIRVGLEDTGFYEKGVVATNEMLVARAARIVREFGCEPATPDEARKMLGLTR